MTPQELAEFDRAIHLQIDLLRHATSTEGAVLRLLEDLRRQLLAKIASGTLTQWGKARVAAMLKDADGIIQNTYAAIAAEAAKSFEAVSAMIAEREKLQIASLAVTMNKTDAWLGYRMVLLDIAKFEKAWSKNREFYVGPDGAGGIGARYANVVKFIQDNATFEASSVYVKSDGVVGFENGRHRYAALRDAGNATIPVAMDAESAENARKAGYLSAGAVDTVQVSLALSVPSKGVLASLVKDALIEGAPSAAWWKRQAGDTAFRFANAVRQGIAQGLTNDQIFRTVREVTDLAQRNSRALVQTSIMQAAGDARAALIAANEDIYKGYRHLSTLDGHTTPQCIVRSGLMWTLDKEPIGHDVPFKQPPVHWGCRSVMLGILKTPAELGLKLQLPASGTRASSEGQIDRNTTFDAYLSRQSAAQQDAQLGVGKAQLWRDGKITLRDLLDRNGNPLTLEQLRSRYE